MYGENRCVAVCKQLNLSFRKGAFLLYLPAVRLSAVEAIVLLVRMAVPALQINSLSLSMIPAELLKSYDATVRTYETGDYIYEKHSLALHYFQIVSGQVKLSNTSEDGKEFIQHIFETGQCFGEALLFLDRSYPTDAAALSASTVLELPKDRFFELLHAHPQYSLAINRTLAQRLYYKMLMSQNLFSKDPHVRLSGLMDYFKQTHSTCTSLYCLPLTRQQMANLTGLRVETVIRTVKMMEKEGQLQINDRKIYY